MDIPAWLMQLLMPAAGAVGVYAAIRADLARLHERATQAMALAQNANARIDALTTIKR